MIYIKECSARFLLRVFLVFRLTFRSLTPLNLLLYMVWENVLISLFYVLMASFPSTIYDETVFYPLHMTCLLCHRLNCKCLGFFLGSVFSSIVLSVCFASVPCDCDYCIFVVQPEVREHDTSSFAFFFQDYFGYSGSFCGSV